MCGKLLSPKAPGDHSHGGDLLRVNVSVAGDLVKLARDRFPTSFWGFQNTAVWGSGNGTPAISGESRLVKCYYLARGDGILPSYEGIIINRIPSKPPGFHGK